MWIQWMENANAWKCMELQVNGNANEWNADDENANECGYNAWKCKCMENANACGYNGYNACCMN